MRSPPTLASIIEAHGGLTAFAKAIGHKVSTVQYWRDNDRIPAEAVPVIARVTGRSRAELRPDLYGEAA